MSLLTGCVIMRDLMGGNGDGVLFDVLPVDNHEGVSLLTGWVIMSMYHYERPNGR